MKPHDVKIEELGFGRIQFAARISWKVEASIKLWAFMKTRSKMKSATQPRICFTALMSKERCHEGKIFAGCYLGDCSPRCALGQSYHLGTIRLKSKCEIEEHSSYDWTHNISFNKNWIQFNAILPQKWFWRKYLK